MNKAKHTDHSLMINRAVILLIIFAILFTNSSVNTLAAYSRTEISGTVYEFDKDSHYEFHENKDELKKAEETYGTFSVSGNISNVGKKDGVPSYEVADGNLSFFYNYSDTKLNADEDSWHLIDDNSKKVADITLDNNIMKGAIILQTSRDRKTWIDVESITNAFSDTPIRTNSIYTTTDVQLINGYYYRAIIAYELRIRTEKSSFLFINTDKHDYKKCAEVYEFYAFTDSGESDTTDTKQTYNLGSKVRAKNFDGYSGQETIDKNDPHYGWDLGNFFVSGYTDEIKNSDEDIVFLKNVGDKVTLWFKLNENINGLCGNEDLTVTADIRVPRVLSVGQYKIFI